MLMRADPAPLAAQRFLDDALPRLRAPREAAPGRLRWGVDLGTATMVVAAVDAGGRPVYWNAAAARVVRDGVVVDFAGAVELLRRLKHEAEVALGVPLEAAATAHPPAVPASDCRACRHVLQQAGIACRALLDEVSAANTLLQVRDGAVVDVGGGSTGVGLFEGGALVRLDDQPGGGHHLDLILAGALRQPVEAAEAIKRARGAELLPVLAPGIERIAESVRRQCGGRDPGRVHLAGGALQLPGAAAIVGRYLGWAVQDYRHAELITPFGIALAGDEG